jgi:hypothetical protein
MTNIGALFIIEKIYICCEKLGDKFRDKIALEFRIVMSYRPPLILLKY